MSCLSPPPFISLRQAKYLACVLGINLQVISLREWRRSLEEERDRNWPELCNIYSLAEEVRDNLSSNRNYYRRGEPYINPALVRTDERCRPGELLNYTDVEFSFLSF